MNKKLARNVLTVGLALSSVFNAFADTYAMPESDYMKEDFFFLHETAQKENKFFLYNAAEETYNQFVDGEEVRVIKADEISMSDPDPKTGRREIYFVFDADKLEENKQYIFANPFTDVDATLYLTGSLKNSVLKTHNCSLYVEKLEGKSHIKVSNDSTDDSIDNLDSKFANRLNVVIGYIGADASIAATKGTNIKINDDTSDAEAYIYSHPSKDQVVFSY